MNKLWLNVAKIGYHTYGIKVGTSLGHANESHNGSPVPFEWLCLNDYATYV